MESIYTASEMTIGVEIEVLFWTDVGMEEFRRSSGTDRISIRNEAFFQWVEDQLRMRGIQSFFDQSWIDAESFAREKRLRPRLWKITDDGSVEPEETDARLWSDKMYWMSVELSSPPLPLSQASLDEVSTVAQALALMGAETPSSTGLHVHISVKDGYTFQDIKGIALSSIAYKQLRQFHPKQRVLSKYCICPAGQFADPHPKEIEAEIQECRTMGQVIDLMQIPLRARTDPHYTEIGMSLVRYAAINYVNVLKEMGTIEFRTHCAIVEIGRSSPGNFLPVYMQIRRDHVNDGRNYTAVRLFQDLGKPEIAALWVGELYLHSWTDQDVFPKLEAHIIGFGQQHQWNETTLDDGNLFDDGNLDVEPMEEVDWADAPYDWNLW